MKHLKPELNQPAINPMQLSDATSSETYQENVSDALMLAMQKAEKGENCKISVAAASSAYNKVCGIRLLPSLSSRYQVLSTCIKGCRMSRR